VRFSAVRLYSVIPAKAGIHVLEKSYRHKFSARFGAMAASINLFVLADSIKITPRIGH
jgi:hypothetical protein